MKETFHFPAFCTQKCLFHTSSGTKHIQTHDLNIAHSIRLKQNQIEGGLDFNYSKRDSKNNKIKLLMFAFISKNALKYYTYYKTLSSISAFELVW